MLSACVGVYTARNSVANTTSKRRFSKSANTTFGSWVCTTLQNKHANAVVVNTTFWEV